MEICKYGDKCFRKGNAKHMASFSHEQLSEISQKKLSENSDQENKTPADQRRESLEKQPSKKRKPNESPKSPDNPEPVKPNDDNNQTERSDKKDEIEKVDLTKVDDLKKLVLEHNSGMQMPEDFYELLEFCKNINPNDPKNALKLLSVKLCGIYDLVLSGEKLNYKLHSRHFFDPPEFQTVLEVTDSDTLLHFGYFRDDPADYPTFVAYNEPILNSIITCRGDNIFCAINWYIGELLSNKIYKSKATSNELRDLKTKIESWLESKDLKKKFSMQPVTPRIKSREKKVNCKTLHQAGLVVPVDPRGFGYREVPETLDAQKRMFSNACVKDNEKKRSKGEDDIQEIVTLIQFANDEGDFGMGLEFGLNMFSFGEFGLHRYVRATLPVCYNLLGRRVYADILKEHLKNRKQQRLSAD